MRRDRLITMLYGSGTLLGGAALGVLPAFGTGSLYQAWFAGFAAASVAAFATAELLRRKRRAVLERNGTAYVVQESAAEWARQDEREFLDSADRYFARVIRVPGPGRLGRTWEWPLDDGAQRWEDKVTELVNAFLALHTDDNPRSPTGILMWAWWAVAAAFGMRASAVDRDLVLDVWQRPSHGRAGQVETVIGAQRPHRFGYTDPPRLAEILPESAPVKVSWPAELAVTRRTPGPATGNHVSVLLLRLGQEKWGPLSVEPEPVGKQHLKIEDAAGVAAGGTADTLIHELRCVTPQDGRFPWDAFPSLVAECVGWIERKSRELNGHTLLLGTTMPPETALGIGIAAGQERHRSAWPQNMWPLVYQRSRDTLVVPRLNLGTSWERRCQP